MKIFNAIFMVLFVVFAALQYNDPDPWLWIVIYLIAAVQCFLAYRRRYSRIFNLVAMGVFSIYAVYLFMGPTGVWSWVTEHHAESIVQTMQAQKPWIEETREFFGLVILIVVSLINMAWLRAQPAGKVQVTA